MLRSLDVPLLVTHGREDSVVLPAMAEHVLDTCPTAEASWYEDVGHVPHLEDPERFNRELAELTRRASALAGEGEAVGEREHDDVDALVGGDEVVEGLDRHGVVVVCLRGR